MAQGSEWTTTTDECVIKNIDWGKASRETSLLTGSSGGLYGALGNALFGLANHFWRYQAKQNEKHGRIVRR